jgi:hypothetical protein
LYQSAVVRYQLLFQRTNFFRHLFLILVFKKSEQQLPVLTFNEYPAIGNTCSLAGSLKDDN